METSLRAAAVTLVLLVFAGAGGIPSALAEAEGPGTDDRQELMSRIDFGNTYVMGQSIKSGAVYLLNRKKSEIESMLDYREDFRKEIREDAEVLDRELP